MINKRFKILIIIAICLALVHLGITIREGLRSLKIPPTNTKPIIVKQAASAISRIRGGNDKNIDSRLVVPENNRVFVTFYDIACKYCKPEEMDFSQEVTLDSVISSGELLKGIASVKKCRGSPEDKYYFVEKKSDGRIALLNASYCKGYQPLQTWMYEGLNSLFDQLDHNEILLSMFYNKGLNRSDQLTESVSDRINKLRNVLDDHYVYRIYVNPASCEEDSLFEIKGNLLKFLLEGNFIRKNPETNESIVWNDEIPFKLKQSFSERYISAFFYKGQTMDPSKEKYFKYLLKMVVEGCNEIALKTENSAFQEYCYSGYINAADLIDFSNKVIALNLSPETVLAAYSMKAYCYLDMNETEQAKQLAMEALNLYDDLYQDRFGSILNFQGAVSCLTYMMKTENDPQTIREYIESLENPSNKPEFANYLLFVKAVLTELMDFSIEETIAAFENVHFDHEKRVRIMGLGNYKDDLQGFFYVDYFLNKLKTDIEETITMTEPFSVRKFLLSDNSQTLNLSGNMDVIIIQKQLSSSASRLTINENYIWEKAKIGNEIYWIQTTEEKIFGI